MALGGGQTEWDLPPLLSERLCADVHDGLVAEDALNLKHVGNIFCFILFRFCFVLFVLSYTVFWLQYIYCLFC